MDRVYNFAAGPAVLPIEALQQAQDEFLNYGDSGMNVMEMSHRSRDFQDIIDTAEADLRELMLIPDGYKVLFLQGGASLQFLEVPMNLMTKHKRAHFVNTGAWSKKAIAEAKLVGDANVVASSEDRNFTYIPELTADMFTPDADYVHITSNNTIYGTEYHSLPPVGDLPLVSDMSSCILSGVLDVSKFALIYAGAQKNIGPAGLTIVIVREDLVENAPAGLPHMLSYKVQADNGSMFNTPPTYAIYMAGLVFQHLKKLGGLAEMQKINEHKASLLYSYIDSSAMFSNPVRPEDRSDMNVPFITGNPETDAAFLAFARENGLVNLKGHRSVGGMRASIYNAMPVEGVEKLIEVMKEFESRY